MVKNIDYLIIGHGIAGTLLAYFLLKRGKSIAITDAYSSSSSSRVAAGIYNPITGRRFVKTWRADEIFSFAENTYREIELKIGGNFYHPRKIIRSLSDKAEEKEWERKSQLPDYSGYTGETFLEGGVKKVEILRGGHVNLNRFIDLMRDKLKHQNILQEDKLDYNDLLISEDFIEWKNFRATKLIFCEGIEALENPWFGHLPFTHAKGDILTIHCPALKIDHIISKGIFILPLGADKYRVGATYNWDDMTTTPTLKGREELISKLEKILDEDYTIVDHQAGIRPTVKDRRPLIGMHADYPRIGIFNGLGTKGVSLGPFFADHFVQFLEDKIPLDPEVDILRFI